MNTKLVHVWSMTVLYVYMYICKLHYLIACVYSGMYGNQKTTHGNPFSFYHMDPEIELRSLGSVASTFTLCHLTSPIIISSSFPFFPSFSFRIENTHLDSWICGQFIPLRNVVSIVLYRVEAICWALGKHDNHRQRVVSAVRAQWALNTSALSLQGGFFEV